MAKEKLPDIEKPKSRTLILDDLNKSIHLHFVSKRLSFHKQSVFSILLLSILSKKANSTN